VDYHLDVGQKPGGILDLVDEDRRWKPLEEEGRVPHREVKSQGIVQGDIGPCVPGCMPQKRGLAHLPGPGHEEYRELFPCRDYEGLKCAAAVHVTLSYRLYCNSNAI